MAPEHLTQLLEQLGPEWHYAGSVAVDSGAVLVADAAGDMPDAVALDQARARGSYGPVPLSGAPLHTAVLCDSGLGDGRYPVVVRLVEVPGWGDRVAELRVLFLDQEVG
jgi:hypothetical protein